jgi:hypothetical protein
LTHESVHGCHRLGSQSHCVLPKREGRKIGEKTFKHGGEELAELAPR